MAARKAKVSGGRNREEMASRVRLNYHLVFGAVLTTGQRHGEDLPPSCKSSGQLWEANGRAPGVFLPNDGEEMDLPKVPSRDAEVLPWVRKVTGMLANMLVVQGGTG